MRVMLIETVGNYEKVAFFNPENAKQLSELMKAEILGTPTYSKQSVSDPGMPFCRNWRELFSQLLN